MTAPLLFFLSLLAHRDLKPANVLIAELADLLERFEPEARA